MDEKKDRFDKSEDPFEELKAGINKVLERKRKRLQDKIRLENT